jgi:hypothetical protein
MPTIFSNNITLPEKRDRFNRAVLEGMESLPETWQASIFTPQETSTYVEVTIEGPDTFAWTCRFTGPNEQEARFVKTTIRNGLLPFLTEKQRGERRTRNAGRRQ